MRKILLLAVIFVIGALLAIAGSGRKGR